jgi:FkbM family methyltransferase
MLPARMKNISTRIFGRYEAYRKVRPFKFLLHVDRFTEMDLNFFGKKIRIVDGPSFFSMYREIWLSEIYKLKNIGRTPLFIDCGANIGLGSIYLKEKHPGAKIICFEPDKRVFSVLKTNIHERYGFTDVELVNKGVWKEETTLEFFSEGADGGRIKTDSDKENIVSIEVTKLSRYIDQEVDFLKIDIEGAEFEVIKEVEDKLSKVRNIFIEYHSFANQEQNLPELLQILKKAGFRLNIVSLGPFHRTPLYERFEYGGMDMQLNIFGTRG